MKPEIEIYFAKFYRRDPGLGWRFTLFEIYNFDSGAEWALFAIDWQPENAPDGKRLTVNLL